MPQLSLYLDVPTHKRLAARARKRGVSLSKCVAELIRNETADVWPDEVLALAGAWTDFPALEEIRAGVGEDAPREPL